MTSLRRPARGVPLAVLAGGGAFAGCLVSLAAVGFVLHRHGWTTDDVTALATGLMVAALVGVTMGVATSRVSDGLRSLRAEAVRRLQDPEAAFAVTASERSAVRQVFELADLARVLDALQMRVRVADEVAERHRRSAETTSAGMFELLSGLVAAEEGARGQLSAELHDTVAQTLMLARSHLSQLMATEATAAAGTDADLGRVGDLVSEAEDQVRAVMARTRPPALREGDLALAVASLRDDLELRYGLTVRLSWPQRPHPLPLVTAVTVYRFFQEALLNVVKHADVDEAHASLAVDDDGVTAVVFDEGPGFNPEEVRPDRGRHVGLGLLRERARLAGGSLEVTSWPGDGTTLRLSLPRETGAPATVPMQARRTVRVG